MAFGAGVLSAEKLHEHAADLNSIGRAIGKDGDLRLWSCETGQGERGSRFVSALARVTGSDRCRDWTGWFLFTRRVLGAGSAKWSAWCLPATDGGGTRKLRRGDEHFHIQSQRTLEHIYLHDWHGAGDRAERDVYRSRQQDVRRVHVGRFASGRGYNGRAWDQLNNWRRDYRQWREYPL